MVRLPATPSSIPGSPGAATLDSVSISPSVPPAPEGVPSKAHVVLSQVIYLLFCLEVGLVLLLLPWTLLWDNNYFFSLQPQHSEFWLSNYLRGAVSGVGLVNLWMGLRELRRIVRSRRA